LDILFRQGTVRFPSMVTSVFLVSLIFGAGVYGPAGWALSRFASVMQYNFDSPPFARFDMVLYNRWTYAWRQPRPGDIVLFTSMNQPAVREEGPGRPGRYVVRENDGIDRILAGPNDHVVWDDGR